MNTFRGFTLLIIVLTITRVLILPFIHSIEKDKLVKIKTDSPHLTIQGQFKPPKSSKPKGSSGAGSRRIFSSQEDIISSKNNDNIG
jgi:hypothetical protein